MLSTPHANILKELNSLQHRIDELRTMLREESVEAEILDDRFYLLVCRTDQETVGVILKEVEEVLSICWVSPVPDALPWFPGLLNLGGEMVPILDLNARINGARHPTALSDSIVICSNQGKRLGLIVSEVVGVHEKTKESVQTVSDRIVASPYLLGVTDIDGHPVLLLSVSSLLSSSQLPGEAL